MTSIMTPEFTESSSQNKAREALNRISHYRIDPIHIKMTETSPYKTGGEGVVRAGTIELPGEASAQAKIFISWLKKNAGLQNISLESLRSQLPRLKAELGQWPHGMPLNLAVEMIAMSPEALNQWCPKVRVAVKKLKWNRNDYEESAKRLRSFVHELSLMAELSHPNIIGMIGFVEVMENGDAWIILPWETNGNVRDFLHSGEWDLAERISLIQDTARGLEYLHSYQPPICHGDLKSLNILVNSSYRAVITDFGSARIKQHVASGESGNASVTPPGAVLNDGRAGHWTSPQVEFNPSTFDLTLTGPMYSLRWTAPEVLGGEEQDLPSDMWAIGWIGWEIITGKIPFEGLNTEGAIIHSTVTGTLPAIREDADLSHILMLCNLMSECWHFGPAQRINASAFQQKVGLIPSAAPSGFTPGGLKGRDIELLLQRGQIYDLQGDQMNALSYYQSALDIATQTENEGEKGNALRYLGNLYRSQSKHHEAEQAFMKAHDIYSRSGGDSGLASALAGLGQIYLMQAKYHQAEKAFSEANQMFSRSGNQQGVADALLGLARTYKCEFRHREAEHAYMDAHEVHSRIGNDMGAAFALGGLGDIYRAQLKHSEAEKVFAEAHEIHSRIGNRVGVAQSLRGLGHTYRAQSRFQEAEKAFNKAYEAYPSDSDIQHVANQFRSLGILYQDQGRHNEAEVYHHQALAAYDRADDVDSRAITLLALGELYYAQARYSDAEEATAEALAVGISLNNDQLQASAHSARVQIFRSQSKHREEVESLIQAGESLSRIGQHEAYAVSLAQLGTTHMAQGMYAEAEEYYRHAQAIFSSIEDATGEASVLVSLGVLYVGQGRHDEAEECFAQARIARAAVADEGDRIKALDVLIASSATLRRSGDAKVACIEACEFLSRTGSHAIHASTLQRLGDIHAKEGAYDKAEESYRHAQAIFLSLEDVHGKAGVLNGLGALYGCQGRHNEAEECFAQARIAYAMVADEEGEAKALEGLMVAYASQRKFGAAKTACIEACEMYAQRGQPMSGICAHTWELLQRLDSSPLGPLFARPFQS